MIAPPFVQDSPAQLLQAIGDAQVYVVHRCIHLYIQAVHWYHYGVGGPWTPRGRQLHNNIVPFFVHYFHGGCTKRMCTIIYRDPIVTLCIVTGDGWTPTIFGPPSPNIWVWTP